MTRQLTVRGLALLSESGKTFCIPFLKLHVVYIHVRVCKCACVPLRICDEFIIHITPLFKTFGIFSWQHGSKSLGWQPKPSPLFTMFLCKINSHLLPPLLQLTLSSNYPNECVTSLAHCTVHALIMPLMQYYSILCSLIRILFIRRTTWDQKA